MKKVLLAAAFATTLTAAQPASAHPALLLIPIMAHTGAAAWMAGAAGAGGLLIGSWLGHMWWNQPQTVAVAAPAPVGVCHLSHRWVNGYRVPVQVCVTEVAQQ